MGKILSRIEKFLYKNRVPFSVVMETTKKCNLDCVHCYVDHSNSELNIDDIKEFQKKIVSEINDMGVFSISFSGGEFFILPYWKELITFTRGLGLGVKILTNGVLITNEIASFLAEIGILEVDISIYSHNKETHDSITLMKGSFDMAINSIKLLREYKIPVIIKTPIMKQNYRDIEEIYQLSLDLDVVPMFDLTITPAENGVRDPLKYSLSENEIDELLSSEKIREIFFKYRVFEEFCGDNRVDDARCGIGRVVMWIDYFGNVYPCIQYPNPVGNLKESDLKTIWYNNDKMSDILEKSSYKNYSKCHFCDLNSYCTPCIALSVIEKKNSSCNYNSYIQAKITKKYIKNQIK